MIELPYLMVLVEALIEFESQVNTHKNAILPYYNNRYFTTIGNAFQIVTQHCHSMDLQPRLFLENYLENNPFLYILTPAARHKKGAIWAKKSISLKQSFSIRVLVNCVPSQEIYAADGFCFVLQTQGLQALGNDGNQTGYGGIQGNSLAVRVNTYYDDFFEIGQHLRLCKNGNIQELIGGLKTIPTNTLISDNTFHEMEYYWNAQKATFSISFEGELIESYKLDLSELFNQEEVYWGFTASTGDCYALHAVYIQSVEFF